MSPTAWLIVRALHLAAMALFVGGQLMLVIAIVPVLRARDRDGLRRIARRFGWASLVAIGVLLATGAAMASRAGQWGNPTLHLKLGLVVVAALLVAWHIRRPTAHVLEVLVLVLSLAILYLGLALAHGPSPLPSAASLGLLDGRRDVGQLTFGHGLLDEREQNPLLCRMWR